MAAKNIEAMQDITITTHKPGRAYLGPHLFILCKGRNSGKPLREACANCFVIRFSDWSDFDACYYLAYSLWKAKFWHYYLVGSVILFVRLFEFKKAFREKAEALSREQSRHMKNIQALQLLEHREADFRKKLRLISEMRLAILSNYANQ